MFSGAVTYIDPIANFTPFDHFAQVVNCTQPPVKERFACLRAIPADVISNLTNADPVNLSFENPMVDKYVSFVFPWNVVMRMLMVSVRLPLV